MFFVLALAAFLFYLLTRKGIHVKWNKNTKIPKECINRVEACTGNRKHALARNQAWNADAVLIFLWSFYFLHFFFFFFFSYFFSSTSPFSYFCFSHPILFLHLPHLCLKNYIYLYTPFYTGKKKIRIFITLSLHLIEWWIRPCISMEYRRCSPQNFLREMTAYPPPVYAALTSSEASNQCVENMPANLHALLHRCHEMNFNIDTIQQIMTPNDKEFCLSYFFSFLHVSFSKIHVHCIYLSTGHAKKMSMCFR